MRVASPELAGESEDGGSGSDEEEERPEVDSHEEINNGAEESQPALEDADEVRPGKRLHTKTSPLWAPVVPAYSDYPPNAWPNAWQGGEAPKPGQVGFNKYAATCVRGVLSWWAERGLHSSHKVYQQTALAACHPLSPCKRVLVDARMGAGKTKVLISVLDAHFQDPRKKLPIFPTKALTSNFLDELVRWASKYRSYFALLQPRLAGRAVSLSDDLSIEDLRAALDKVQEAEWKVPSELAQEVRQRLQVELEMTDIRKETGQKVCAVNRGRLTKTFRQWFQMQFPTKQHLMPGGPLRAMNLSTAGGSFSAKKPSGEARHPVAQFGYDVESMNVFDNSVVVIDEVHNLISHFTSSKVKLLPRQLLTARGISLVGSLANLHSVQWDSTRLD